MHETIDEQEAEPDHQVEIADRGPEEMQCEIHGIFDVRDRRHAIGDVVAVVELEEEVAGDPEREEVDRGAADDLVGAEVDREERVDERQHRRRRRIATTRPATHLRPCRRRTRPRRRPSASSPRGRCSRRRSARRTCRRSPAKTSGVENTNVCAIRSAWKTVFRLSVLECVARIPSPIPAHPPRPRRSRAGAAPRRRPEPDRDRDDPDDDRPRRSTAPRSAGSSRKRGEHAEQQSPA